MRTWKIMISVFVILCIGVQALARETEDMHVVRKYSCNEIVSNDEGMQSLAGLCCEVVDSVSWKKHGGSAELTIQGMSLTIEQTVENHKTICKLLTAIEHCPIALNAKTKTSLTKTSYFLGEEPSDDQGQMDIIAYPIGDVCHAQQMSVAEMSQFIRLTTNQRYWSDQGGQSVISTFVYRPVVIVTALPKVHDQVLSCLSGLRSEISTD